MTTRSAGVAEDLVLHHGVDGGPGLLPGLRDDHALAQGQAVGLDHDGKAAGLQIGAGRSPASEKTS